MIKVGIAGADNAVAGELMRLCLRHPDVDIVSAYAPKLAGHSVDTQHHGFIGEEKILFSSNFDATSLDVAFIFTPLYTDADWAKLMSDRDSLRLIIFPGSEEIARALPRTPVYGLPEMNRKPLVRGAREAVVPDSLASPALVALYPLASHLMLGGHLTIKVKAPKDLITPFRIRHSEAEIAEQLAGVQASFLGKINIEAEDSGSHRSMALTMRIPSNVSLEELLKIYDSVYDDHNFTYVVTHPVGPEEVESTDKVIISISKPTPQEIELKVVADPRMRGGAGEAIHIMNLLLGLHEKTGLDLKTSSWTKG
ncbi:MAG: hypothetical protein K2M31_01750 [Muribaculaceae bacterium]|nr:hypothetical protein [Muribaculaceae bacterium]